MNNFSRQPGTDMQQLNSFFAGLQAINRIINWLAGLVELTEEEEQNAGIYYPNHQRYE